jgi:hypothetical protein
MDVHDIFFEAVLSSSLRNTDEISWFEKLGKLSDRLWCNPNFCTDFVRWEKFLICFPKSFFFLRKKCQLRKSSVGLRFDRIFFQTLAKYYCHFFTKPMIFKNYNPIWDSISRPIGVPLKPMVLILHTQQQHIFKMPIISTLYFSHFSEIAHT